jgi:hypothetical protein
MRGASNPSSTHLARGGIRDPPGRSNHNCASASTRAPPGMHAPGDSFAVARCWARGRPASTFDRSRMSFTSCSRCWPLLRMPPRNSCYFAFKPPGFSSRRNSEKPMMLLRGVRSSVGGVFVPEPYGSQRLPGVSARALCAPLFSWRKPRCSEAFLYVPGWTQLCRSAAKITRPPWTCFPQRVTFPCLRISIPRKRTASQDLC